MVKRFRNRIVDLIPRLQGRSEDTRKDFRSAKPKSRKLLFETLENRRLLAADLAARFEFTNPSGQALTSLQSNSDYLLKMFVSDSRTTPAGIKQVYFDVSYPSNLISINGSIDHGSIFTSSPFGDSLTAGVLNEIGGRDPDIPPIPANAEGLLFSVPFRTNNSGTLNVTAVTGSRLSFFFDTVVGLQPSNVMYSGGTIEIVAAGIAISPVAGLLTTENGATASFNAVLQSQPTANVSFAVSSNNTNEGTISTSSLTFTPANWNVPQTVSITGVDEAVVDGDQIYSIITEAAVSSDSRYSGFNPPDVQVTNRDNDTATLSISAPLITESNIDQTVNFSATSNRAVSGGFSVAFSGSDGSATAGLDYLLASISPLNFTGLAGETKNIAVTIKGDSIVEGNETFSIALGAITTVAPIPVTSIITGAFASGTIVDEDIGLSIAPLDATKVEGNSGTTNLTFNVTRLGVTSGTVSINYSVAGSGANAANASDFVGGFPTGSITFNPGQVSKILSIPVSGDLNIEPDEALLVTLSGATSGAQIINATGQGTIQDDDSSLAIVAINSNQPEGNSGVTPFTFTITRNGLISNSVNVDYAVSGSGANAADAADFGGTLPTGQISFAPNETSKTLTINVSGDNVGELDEQFTVTLSNASSNLQIIGGTAIGTIINDDSSFSIAATDANKAEANNGTTPFLFTVSRTGMVSGTTTVNYAVVPGATSSANVADFGGTFPSGQLTFEPNEQTKTISINVIGDATVEAIENFSVTLSNASGGIQITTANASGIIQNDDIATLSIVAPIITESSVDQTVNFTVTLDKAVEDGFSVAFANNDGTANNLDYQIQTTSPLTFSGTAGENRSIAVVIKGDQRVEGNETFTIVLGNVIASKVLSSSIVSGATATGAIGDEDSSVLTIGSVSQSEGTGSTPSIFRFDVTLSNAVSGGFDLPFNVSGGTAISGTDLIVPTSTSLRFAGTQGEIQSIFVSVIADSIVENDETLSVTLGSIANLIGGISSSRITVPTSPAIGTIRDDDNATLAISNVSRTEGNNGVTQFVFDVTLSNPVASSFNVAFSVQPGTAVVGEDFLLPTNNSLQFNGLSNEVQSISVSVNSDLISEADETFLVNLGAISNLSSGISSARISVATNPATGTIINDDIATLTINDVSRAEGNSGQSPFAFTVTLSQSVDVPVSVDYTTADVTALLSDSDYQPISGTLTFMPNGPLSQIVTVQVNGDENVEPIETFKIRLSNVSAGTPRRSVTIDRNEGIGTIVADDGVLLSISDVSANEGNNGTQQLTFNVTLSKADVVPVNVDFRTVDGTATTADNDYALKQGTLTFLPGNPLTQQITITINGDNKVERDETFQVLLSNVSTNSSNVILSKSAGIGTLVNDDTVTISIGDAQIAEGDTGTKNLVFNVTLSQPVDLSVSFSYATSDDTALSAANDYVPKTGTVVFNPGDPLTKSISVVVTGDSLVENDERFRVELSNLLVDPASSSVSFGKTVGIGTILNDDAGVLSMSATRQAIEESTDGEFTISSSRRFQTPVTLSLSVSGNAVSGQDYAAIATTIVFPANVDSIKIPISILADKLVEGDETVSVSLLGVDSAQATIGPQNSANVVITDNDTARLSIETSKSIVENASSILIIATLMTSDGLGGTATLAPGVSLMADVVDLLSGTATSGSDYASIATQQISFASGAADGATASVTFTPTNDSLIEGNETVRLRIQNLRSTLNGQASLGNSECVVTIIDNDTATISIQATSSTREEQETQSIVVSLSTSDGAGGTATIAPGLVLNVNVVDAGGGTATSGLDYVALGTKTVSFASGSANGATKSIDVSLLNDALVEGNESIRLRLQNPNPTTPILSLGNTESSVMIVDNDTARLSIESSKIVNEQSGAQKIFVTLTTSDGAGGVATLGPSTSLSAQVIDAGGGSATSGVDYQAFGTQTVSFSANDGNNTSKSVEVVPVSRAGLDPARTINLTLQPLSSSLDGQASLGNSVSLVTVNDAPPSSELRGFVFVDTNGNGRRDSEVEPGIVGVTVTLTGVDIVGASIRLVAMTADDGSYGFTGLRSGTYQILETQPAAFTNGIASSSMTGASVASDSLTNLRLENDSVVSNNNFGEQGLRAKYITIRMTVASMIGKSTLMRSTVAIAEENAGRVAEANQIRARSIPSVIANVSNTPIPVASRARNFAVSSVNNSSSDALGEGESAPVNIAVPIINDFTESIRERTAVLIEKPESPVPFPSATTSPSSIITRPSILKTLSSSSISTNSKPDAKLVDHVFSSIPQQPLPDTDASFSLHSPFGGEKVEITNESIEPTNRFSRWGRPLRRS